MSTSGGEWGKLEAPALGFSFPSLFMLLCIPLYDKKHDSKVELQSNPCHSVLEPLTVIIRILSYCVWMASFTDEVS